MKLYLVPLAIALLAVPAYLSVPASAEMHDDKAADHMSHSMLKPYVAADAKAAIEAGKPVVIHFHKQGCPTCAAQLPTVESFLHGRDTVLAYQVDFTKDEEANKAYEVKMQSTIILFRDGKELARSTGETDPVKLTALLAQVAG
jgi:thiol-disulfide isomerase/thioredoxin